MAASGYTPIILLNSTTTGNTPTTSNLAVGELAINVTDGKLFFNQSGTIKVLANATYATSVSTISFGTTGLTPSTATNGVVTVAGTLATTNGGTGLTSFTANGLVYASSTSALATGSALTFDGSRFAVITSGNTGASIASYDATASKVYIQAGGASPTAAYVQLGVDGSNGTSYLNDYYGVGLVFQRAGSEQMRLNSTGLGIGTSSPSYKLDVNGTARFNNTFDFGAGQAITSGSGSYKAAKFGAASGAYNVLFSGSTAFNINDNADTVNLLVLTNSGNLGLGVTPSAWGSYYKVIQTPAGALSNYTTIALCLHQNSYDTFAGSFKYLTTNYASRYNQEAGVHSWYTAPSGTAGNAISFTQAMTLDASGNLGIGTTSPAYNLDISSASATTIRLKTATATAGSGTVLFEIANNFSGVSQAYIKGNGFGNSGLSYLTFGVATSTGATTATEVMRIDTSGNLLVGQNFNANGFKFQITGSSGSAGDLGLDSNATYSEIQSFNSKNLYLNRQGNDVVIANSNLLVGTTTAFAKLTVAGGVAPVNPPNTSWGLDFGTSTGAGSFVTLANGSSYNFVGGAGCVWIYEQSSTVGLCVANCAYGGVTFMSNPSGNYTASVGTASKTNVYYNSASGSYALQNNSGATYAYWIATMRVRQSS
jgi:hypothetical protein